jgi:hypothetical protein
MATHRPGRKTARSHPRPRAAAPEPSQIPPGTPEDISELPPVLGTPNAAPDPDALIRAATSAADRSSPTALDDLAAELREAERPAAPAQQPRERSVPGQRRRGRPANTEGPTRAGEPRTTKAELLMRNAELESQLANLTARENVDPEQMTQLANSIGALAHVGFALVAEARGPHWVLADEERRLIGKTSAEAAAPYAEQLQAAAPWAAPLVALAGIIGKRVIIDVQQQRAARGVPQ